MRKITRREKMMVASTAVVVLLSGTVAACDSGGSKKTGRAKDTADLTAAQIAAQTAVPYPVAQLKTGGWLERRLLRENLLRENDPNRLAYAVLLNMQGNPVMQWPIKGRVFSLDSQMTISQVTQNNGKDGITSLDAMGDNGTYGGEPHMVAFFTTSGVEIKVSVGGGNTVIESDAPVHFTTKPVITYNENDRPSVDHGGVSNMGR